MSFRFNPPVAIVGMLALIAFCAVQVPAHAQSYPVKPVRIIVPFSGGSSDLAARIIAPRLQEALKQPFIIENRAGANGAIGSELVARAAPDGYTLLSVLTSHVITSSLIPTSYDPIKDFTPVAAMAVAELAMTVNNDVPVRSLAEFITFARAQANPVLYSTTQLGGNQHLAGELFTLLTGARLTPVPYKGGGEAVMALMGGHVQMYFGSMATMTPFIRSGKVRGIAVTGAKRHADGPEIPTFAEGGLPTLDIRLWYGLLAPAGTPRDIVNRLAEVVLAAIPQPEFRAQLAKMGSDPMPMNPDQFGALLRTESARYLDIIKRANVKIDP